MTSTVRSRSLPGSSIFGCWLLIFALGFYQPLYANPQSPTVVAGAVQFQGGAGQLHINQSSSHAIINWQNFSIDAGELTRFNQPGANAAILNRVVSGNPSAIHGQLQANGQVFLINPNGILVGPGGQIDTAGFLASTLDVSDREFLAGGDLNFSGDSKASIVNLGKIKTIDGGDIFLLSKTIVNEGTLDAEGRVGLGAGSRILLKASGDERIAILPENQEGSISNKGVIQGAVAELKAAGGNQYALAIQNDGMVRAKGFQNRGGKLYLSAGRGRVVNSGQMSATKKVEIKAPAIENTGTIDASNSESAGGEVVLLGRKIELGATSLIIADGATDGGSVYIGGGPRGEAIEGTENAQFTSVAAGSRIQANGSDGVGGKVILWADDTMDYQGHIENTGTTHGGFAEVSGLKTLNFAGTVNTGGGDLLLDPFNYIIDGIAAGNIVTALGSNNVTIDTTVDTAAFGSSGNNLDAGDISVNSNIFYDSTFDLTFLAVGDVNFNASVQNRNATGGDINIVAGWDGTTAFDATTFGAEDIASTTLFGQSNGSINIGDGAQSAGIAVGARAGSTNVFGYDLNLTGSDSTDNAFAQFGFQASDGVGLGGIDLDPGSADGANVNVTGSLSVRLLNSIGAAGGTAIGTHAQLGHIGRDFNGDNTIDANANSVIDVSVGGDINFSGGEVGAYAQLGHGGQLTAGEFRGAVTINSANDMSFRGGENSAYAQLGNGGLTTFGNHNGDITVVQANDLIFSGGEIFAYAQLGSGGLSARGNYGGDITIMQANDLIFSGGENSAYAQLGNGGAAAVGSHSGDIMIIQGNDLIFSGGENSAYAQLGNGGSFSFGDLNGAITITKANDIAFKGGAGNSSYSQLGHGGNLGAGDFIGAITIEEANDLIFSGGLGLNSSYAQLGHGGELSRGDFSGAVSITQVHGDLTFTAGSNLFNYSQLGHGGYRSLGNHSGDIMIGTVDSNVDFSAGDGLGAYVQLGHGGANAAGDHSGTITLESVGDLNFTGGSAESTYAQLGHGGDDATGNATGAITITEAGAIEFAAGSGEFASAQLGHGGNGTGGNHGGDNDGDSSLDGDITITAADSLTLTAAGGNDSYAQLGHGGYAANGTHTGDIMIGSIAGDVTVSGGSGDTAFAQIGHGGYSITGDHSGSITITNVGNDLILSAGNGNSNSAQIGHGGYTADGDLSGNITISTVGNDFLVNGGSDNATYGQVGHGGAFAEGNFSGAINIGSVGNNLTFTGGSEFANYAQLGNGGYSAGSNSSGAISIGSVSNDLRFSAGSGSRAYAQLGHGGGSADGNHGGDNDLDSSLDGDITISSVNNLIFSGGSDSQAFSQLGHGGYGADGSHSGDITISSVTGEINVTGGSAVSTYGQLGHGGQSSNGDHSGNITITDSGDLIFRGGTVRDSLAQLGNGGRSADGNHSGNIDITNAGDITFTGGSGATETYAHLGNGGRSAEGNHSGNISISNVKNLTFTGGGGATETYAHLGNGGRSAEGDHSGEITINNALDIIFTGGSSSESYALLGHGGTGADGDHSGAISIESVRSLTLSAGTVDYSSSQLGHGGFFVDGNHAGDITVNVDGNITLSGDNPNRYARIGHGDENGDSDAASSVEGDISIIAASDLTLTNAEIGHQVDADGSYNSGNTHIGVARNLVADATSQFDSASSGELRFYLSDPTMDFVNAATELNGVAHGAAMTPNNQGTAAFGIGAYAPGSSSTGGATVAGNFNYYTLEDQGLYNYIVESVEGTNITSDLNGGSDVTLAFDLNQPDFGALIDIDGGTQFIRIETDIFYNANQDLNLITTGDIDLKASIQNSHTVGGDLNVVAGFNGANASNTFNAGSFIGENIEATNLFGLNSGSVFIGDGTQTSAVAVGSRSGATNAFGYNLALTGGSGSNLHFAQLGFKATGGIGLDGVDLGGIAADGIDDFVTGNIVAHATSNISLRGGSNFNVFNYAQIGHVGSEFAGGGSTIAANSDASITVAAGSDLSLIAGQGDLSYTQIGHGGSDVEADHSGDITVSLVGDDLILESGSGAHSYSQLGHGGVSTSGDISGAISINSVGGDLILNSENGGDDSYSQLGHGGNSSNGLRSGDISIGSVGNNLKVTGGNSDESYGQIGHGGFESTGNANGDITISDAGDILFAASSGFDGYVQLGHGGRDSDSDNLTGDISINRTGDITFSGGSASYSYANLGHGGSGADANSLSGTITLMDVGAIALTAGTTTSTSARIGHGGSYSDGAKTGDIAIIGAGDLSLNASVGGSGSGSVAVVGHAANEGDGDQSGDILIQDVGNITVNAGRGSSHFAMIGLGGRRAEGVHVGDVTINRAGNITLNATASNSGSFAFAQIGIGLSENSFPGVSANGQITISEVGDISLLSGTAIATTTRIGHGGNSSTGDLSGDIHITNFGSLSLNAGSGTRSVSQLGHGGYSADGNIDGSITISATGPIQLTGVGINEYARIGHGNQADYGDTGFSTAGDISIQTRSDLTLNAAEIGHLVDPDGSYSSGNTYIGVGAVGGTQILTADASSDFLSAPSGELRFYLPSAAANQIAAGASLNGTAAPGPGITPNNQGRYAFGDGPYDLADPGNFAFYILETPPVVIPNPIDPIDPVDPTSPVNPDPSPSLTFDFFDYELIRPLDEKFEPLKPLLHPFWVGDIGVPHLLGSVARQYETYDSTPLTVTSSNGLVFRTNRAGVETGIFQSANGATVTIHSDGGFDYDPISSRSLTQLVDGQFIFDSFAFVILDEDGNPAGIGTATVLVRGEDSLNRTNGENGVPYFPLGR